MGTFTYENQGSNTFLVYSMGMTERIDSLIAGMAANNKIPGVLAPGFVQNNTDRRLKYNISSKISLEQYFSGSVKKRQIIGVLKSITLSLIMAEKYLMTEDSFLLDDRYIFMDVGQAEGYLLCFPVERDMTGQPRYYDFVRRLIYGIKFEETENCAYVATVMNYINRKESFSPEGFLHMLEGLEGEKKAETVLRQDREDRKERVPIQPIIHTQNIQMTTANMFQIPQNAQAEAGMLSVAEIPETAVGEKEALVEKKASFKALFGKKNKKEKKQKPEKQKKGAQKSMGFQIPGTASQPSTPVGQQTQSGQQGQIFPQPTSTQYVSSQEPEKLEEEDFGNTVMMGENEDGVTVMAGSGISEVTGVRQVVLTRLRNGQKMTIDKEIFRIGKSSSFVDFYIGDNRTVSRSHADILLQEQGVYIQDNNSMNHTYVNEKMVLAGERIPLSDGDKIRLSDEEFLITIKNG